MADVAESVDGVSSFSESSVRQSELAELSGIIDADIVHQSESSTNGTDEATTAVIVESTGSAVNDADKHRFIVC